VCGDKSGAYESSFCGGSGVCNRKNFDIGARGCDDGAKGCDEFHCRVALDDAHGTAPERAALHVAALAPAPVPVPGTSACTGAGACSC